MGGTSVAGDNATGKRTAGSDMGLEVVVIPVSDADRAKGFYARLGWRLDADFAYDNGFRVVQFTPPGSGCSVQFGTHITSAAPGSAKGLYLVVSDIEAARKDLAARRRRHRRRVPYRDAGRPVPARRQERSRQRAARPTTEATVPSTRSAIPTATAGCCRRSRRGCPAGSMPPAHLSLPRPTWPARCGARRQPTASTRNASVRADADWPDWYAAYMVAEQAGEELPT